MRNSGSFPAVTPLYIAFALTGFGVALPGALLPILLQRWQLQDAQGGAFFLLAWIGSSLGALLVRGSLRRVLLCGSLSLALGAGGLTICGPRLAYIFITLYGTGLGLTMTSISLIRQHDAASPAKEMVFLNLLWSIGACACPSLTLSTFRTGDIRPILIGLGLCFGLFALWAAFQRRLTAQIAASKANRPWTIFQSTPLSLILMAFLITGVEASTGGWLATYAHRGDRHLAQTIAAPTCFWAGLLLSRLFWSLIRRSDARHFLNTVRASLFMMVCASIELVANQHPLSILIASGCLGFGIGPTYPVLLSWALRFQPGGAIFFIAGVGSAFLPWFTGLVSMTQGSLRIGLIVPAAASVLMLISSLRLPLAKLSADAGVP